jgi:hypothetical protein
MSTGVQGPRGYKGPRGLVGATGWGQFGSETGPTGPRGPIGFFSSQSTLSTTSLTLYASNISTLYKVTTGSTITLTNDNVSTAGAFFVFTNQTSGTCSFTGSGGLTIDGSGSYSLASGKTVMLIYGSSGNFRSSYPYSGFCGTGTVENITT